MSSVVEPLVIPFLVVMIDEFGNRPSKMPFAQRDHAVQTLCLMERTKRSAYAFALGA